MSLSSRLSAASSIRRPLSLRTPVARGALALGVSLSLAGAAMAQSAPVEEEELVLDTLQIEDRTLDTNPYAEKGAPYKARVSGDRRRTETLAETPATISVLTQTLLLLTEN